MGFLDSFRDKIDDMRGRQAGDDRYDDYDDGYDDGYGDGDGYGMSDGYYQQSEPDNGVLGQTRRGEAESVAVYTRSGQLVGDDSRHATMYNPPSRTGDVSLRPGAYDTPSSYTATTSRRAQRSADPGQTGSYAAQPVPAGQLPAYILKPESYDDVETVVRRVRTRQPVALVFNGVRTDVAKRVLDFCYGFACGSGSSVQEVGDRIFMVLPQGCEVQHTDLAKLRTQGYLK